MLTVRRTLFGAATLILAACYGGEEGAQQQASSNPCAAKNVCNPCAAAANPCNPCGAAMAKLDPAKIRQGSRTLYTGGNSTAQLVAMGERLWSDKKLSGPATTSCSTCHVNKYGMMNASFAEPYPHRVKMAKERAGLDQVTAAEMVQLCMVIPMQNDPLAWNSVELAALSEYVKSIQGGFDPSMAAGGMNPCAGKNVCNPCAGKNPCNPCAGKRN